MTAGTDPRALIEERVAKGLYFLRLVERLLHGRDNWQVKINEHVYQVEIVISEERLGVQVLTMHNEESVTGTPVLLCNGKEVWYHPELTLPEHILEFTWWFSLVPTTV